MCIRDRYDAAGVGVGVGRSSCSIEQGIGWVEGPQQFRVDPHPWLGVAFRLAALVEGILELLGGRLLGLVVVVLLVEMVDGALASVGMLVASLAIVLVVVLALAAVLMLVGADPEVAMLVASG